VRRDTVVRTMPGLSTAPGTAEATVLTGGVASAQAPVLGPGRLLETGAPPGTSPVDQARSRDH
jgi:hypothetical protein